MIAHNPLHGSGQAGFPHPVLVLGDNADATQGMTEGRRRQPASDEAPHAVPKDAAFLAAPQERAMPEPPHLEPKDPQRVVVSRHTVISDVSTHHRSQQATYAAEYEQHRNLSIHHESHHSLRRRDRHESLLQRPRSLVFTAITQPELVKQWLLGPPGCTMPVCEIDLRVGGTYRYVWRNADGKEMGLSGVTLEIDPPQHNVATEKFDETWYPGEAPVTTTLTEHEGVTTLTITICYDSRETRAVVLKSGMEKGVAASYDRLADLLPSLRSSVSTKGTPA
jgi:uncharacterized protein YndB with AHSA1/START domain